MRYWAFALVVFLLAGCSTLHQAPQIEERLKRDHPMISEVEKTPPPSVIFFIEEPDPLEAFQNHPAAGDKISVVSGGGETLGNLLRLVQSQTSIMLVPQELDDIDTGIVSFYGTSLHRFLLYLRSRYDVEFSFDPRTEVMEVKKNISRRIILPPIMDSQKGSIGNSDGVSVQAEPDNIREILMSTAEKLSVNIIAVSETTGLIQMHGRPSNVRKLSRIIETEATERLKFVTLHVMFLELVRSNKFDRDFKLESMPNMTALGQDVFGTFKFAVPSALVSADGSSTGTETLGNGAGGSNITVPPGTPSLGVTNRSGNKFTSLITLFEQWGDSEIVTAPAVMTPNGVPVSFDVTDEIGYWEPGELDTTLGDSFGKSITEGKPTFVSDEVGLKLRIRPKIIEDAATGEFLVSLDISLESSEVRDFASVQWQRSADVPPVTLSKPLKSQKIISSRAILRPDELLLLARLDNRRNDNARAGLPGMVGSNNPLIQPFVSQASRVAESQLFIVVDAILPPNLVGTREGAVAEKVGYPLR